MKTGQSNYPIWRTRKKKIWGKKLTKPQRPTGHYQANKDAYNGRMKRKQQNKVWRKKSLKVSNFMKNINLHIQEAQWTLTGINVKRSIHTQTQHTHKVQRQGENSEKSKRKTTSHKAIPGRLTHSISSDTMGIRRQWNNILEVLKVKTVKQEYCIQQNYLSQMKAN